MNTINEEVEDRLKQIQEHGFERFPLKNPMKIIYAKPSEWKMEDPDTYTFISELR